MRPKCNGSLSGLSGWCFRSGAPLLFALHTYYANLRAIRFAAVRAGDYYLFEDLGEKIELDLMTAKMPSVVNDVQMRQRMASKQTIEQV